MHAIIGKHAANINAIVPLADGHVMTASADSTVRKWDARSRIEKFICPHDGYVNHIAVRHPMLLSASADGRVRILDANNGVQQDECNGSDRDDVPVNCIIAFWHRHGAASGAADGTITLWDFDSRKHQRLSGHRGHPVNWLAVNGHDRRLVSAGADGNLMVWDADDGRLARELVGNRQCVDYVMLVNDVAVSAHAGGFVGFTPLSPYGEMNLVRVCRGGVGRLALSADNRMVYAAVSDGLAIVDIASQQMRLLQIDNAGVYDIAVNGMNQVVVAATNGGIYLCDLNEMHVLLLGKHATSAYRVAFSCNGRQVFSSSFDGELRISDVPARRFCESVPNVPSPVAIDTSRRLDSLKSQTKPVSADLRTPIVDAPSQKSNHQAPPLGPNEEDAKLIDEFLKAIGECDLERIVPESNNGSVARDSEVQATTGIDRLPAGWEGMAASIVLATRSDESRSRRLAAAADQFVRVFDSALDVESQHVRLRRYKVIVDSGLLSALRVTASDRETFERLVRGGRAKTDGRLSGRDRDDDLEV